MDDAIDRVKEELDDRNRLDLIKRIAVWNDDFTEAELRSDLNDGREWLNRFRVWGKAGAWVLLIAGSVLLGLLHVPSLKGMLRWPGLTLLLTGILFFVVGKVMESTIPDRLQELVEQESGTTGIPPSVTDLGGDILISFGRQLSGGIDGPSLVLLIVGAALFAASLLAPLLQRRMAESD